MRPLIPAIVGLACFIGGETVARADGAGLIQQMRNTGRPALIIAGNADFTYCRQMAQELSSNESIQPLVSQFLIVTVDSDSPDWTTLQNAFQFKEIGLPAVFVVRGDGKMIYADAGKPRDMGAFLQQMLDSSGVILDADKLQAVQKAAREAQAAFKRRKYARAIELVNEHGGTGSYAVAAVALQQIADELHATAISASDKAELRIGNGKKPVEAAIELLVLRREFSQLASVSGHVEGVWTRLSEHETHKSLMQNAGRLEEAAQHMTAREWDQALAIYREVSQAAPASVAAEYSQEQIPTLERRLAAREANSGTDADNRSDDAETAGAAAAATDTPAESAASDPPAGDPRKAASFLKLAKTFKSKNPEKARDYLQRAISAAPGSAEAEEAQQLLDGLE